MTRSIDARDLPATTRAHLFACMRRRASPAPLHVARPPQGPVAHGALGVGVFVRIALAAVGALGLAVLATCTSSSAPGLATVVAHVAFGAVAASAAVSAWMAWRAGPGGGAEPGVYVFPFDLVDARTRRVRVHPLEATCDVRVRSLDPERGGGATLEIEHADRTTSAIRMRDRASADELRREMRRAIARIRALTADERGAASSIEALHDGEAPAPSTLRPASWSRAPRFLVAAAMTVALFLGPASGAAAFSYAKTVNDDLRFGRANAHPSAASYAEYLASGGGRYEAEVKRTLMPCAELRAIIASSPSIHDYVPLSRFVEKNPSSYCTADAKRVLADKIEGVRVAFAAP